MEKLVLNEDGRSTRFVKEFPLLLKAVDKALMEIYGHDVAYYARPDRRRHVADVRNMSMSITWELSRATLGQVAHSFNRNHATFCVSKQNVVDLRSMYKDYNEEYLKLRAKIYEICEEESILRGERG